MAVYRQMEEAGTLEVTERPIYGSSRLGVDGYKVQIDAYAPPYDPLLNPLGLINYELTDHLGNVATVVTEELEVVDSANDYFQPHIVSAQGYEPFGSLLPGRSYSSNAYRFGFNGMEKDDEMHNSTGNSYDFGARSYDPRVGRFMSIDPKAHSYPWQSAYVFGMNAPTSLIDENGEGPDKVVNNSSSVIVITGSGYLWDAQGNKHEYKDKIYLGPGDVFEELSTVKLDNGTKMTQGQIIRASGEIESTIIDDIDFVDIQPGQRMLIKNMILPDELVTSDSRKFHSDDREIPAQGDLTQPQPTPNDSWSQEPNNGQIKFRDIITTVTFSDGKDKAGNPVINVDNTGPSDPYTP